MRISEFRLERYGRFEDHRLTFAKSERDFHFVFGPNEAGKTTTLAAIADLFFGFEHAVGQDYRFAAGLLRVGGILEQGAERLDCRRRRGRQGTLVDSEDRPIDEGPLIAMLHGQQRDAFLLSSGLDHARLRKGGQAMADSKDDLGQLLFAAGSGLTGLKTVLAGLDADLDELWGPRRSEKRAYTRAERALNEARAAMREASVKPGEWTRAQEELERRQADHASAETARRDAVNALADVERLRRVQGPIARRNILLTELNADTSPRLPAAVEALARQALETAAAQHQIKDTASALLDHVRLRLEKEPADTAAIGLAGRIEALVQLMGAETDRREQSPRRARELVSRRAAAEAGAQRLGLVIKEDLSATLPTEAEIARLRELANRRVQLDVVQTNAQDVLAAAEAELVRAAAADQACQAPEGVEGLRSAVAEARRAGDLDGQVQERQLAYSRADVRLVEALSALAPWVGDVEALASLTLPSDTAINTAKAARDQAERELVDAHRVALERAEELQLLETRIAGLSDRGAAISLEQLTQAREGRTDPLVRLRGHLEGAASLEDPLAELDHLHAAIAAADDVADRRFAAADASARLSQAQTEALELRLRGEQAVKRVQSAEAAIARQMADWRQRLQVAGLTDLAPEDLLGWMERRSRALERREAASEAAAKLRSTETDRVDAINHLKQALGEALGPQGERFTSCLARAEARLVDLEDAARVVAETQRELKEARGRRDAAKLTCDRCDRDGQAWRAAWEAALLEARVTLSAEAAETRLGVFETLRGDLEQARSLKRRIDTMSADADAFAAEAAAVASLMGMALADVDPLDLVRGAKQRLDAGLAAAARRNALEEEAQIRSDEIEAAQAALDAAETALSDVRELTGAADRISLAAALDASHRRRDREERLADLGREIAEQADGRPVEELEAACAADSPESLAERADAFSRDAHDAAQRAQDCGRLAMEAELLFRGLDAGQTAAGAAADLEQARAELESLGEVYVLKRAQRVLLDYAVRRQAERRRNPLLIRAGELFQRLTLGRYIDLRADYESERPRLLAVCAGEAATLPVSELSEGARDQLFLALRVAAVEQGLEAGVRTPFLADDLFITFDNPRARAGLEVLGELSKSTQVLFFTHHAHLRGLAEEVFGRDQLSVHELTEAV